MTQLSEYDRQLHTQFSVYGNAFYSVRLSGEIKGRLKRQRSEAAREVKLRAKKMRWYRPHLLFDSRDRKYWCWREPVAE